MSKDMMKLKMSRSDICRLMQATTHILIDAKRELRDEGTSEDRKKVLEGTIEMWQRIHDEVNHQIDEFDEAH